MDVVIVESPNKTKKIRQILGDGFKVVASVGHFRDLPADRMGFDQKTMQPEYVITKPKVVRELKEACRDAQTIYIATDPDREGEGICMHLVQALNLKYPRFRRMVFHEITHTAVSEALQEARRDGQMNTAMANAYQARRLIDRFVGYTISPVISKHISWKARSAGRVQSVATRLALDREIEIVDHVPEQSFRVVGTFLTSSKEEFQATLIQPVSETKDSLIVMKHVQGSKRFWVGDNTSVEVRNNPPPPFKTSTLQQDAGRRMGLSPKMTMSVAQKLFEKGLITYHRTDLTTLSESFVSAARLLIEARYGPTYFGNQAGKGKEADKNAQGAHEAIRPTDVQKDELAEGSAVEKKVYRMIWVQAVGSLMAREQCLRFSATVLMDSTADFWFKGSHLQTVFKGFTILVASEDEEERANRPIKTLKKDEEVGCLMVESRQTISQPQKRYTETTLVKELESRGIGRPSTFANIVDTIQMRKYVEKKNDQPIKKQCILHTLKLPGPIQEGAYEATFGDSKPRLHLTDLGKQTTEFLLKHTKTIMDYDFTSAMEDNLDQVSSGALEWMEPVARTRVAVAGEVAAIPPKQPLTSEQKAQVKQAKANRLIGSFEGKPMEFMTGQYGPFIKFDGQCFSLPADLNEAGKVSEEAAIKAIETKRAKSRGHVSFETELDGRPGTLSVQTGQYGPYIRFVSKTAGQQGAKPENFNIPKNLVPSDLSTMTLEDCLGFVAEAKTRKSKASTYRR